MFKYVKNKESIKIDPYSEVTRFEKNPFFIKSNHVNFLIENLSKNKKILISSALVKNEKLVPIKIQNLTSNDLIIRKNHYLGKIEPFSSENISTLIESSELGLELKDVPEFH